MVVYQGGVKKETLLPNLFTPYFFLYAAGLLTLAIALRGELAHSWDEFSHWMDSVKAMSYIDDFVTNPESQSAFKSYPPAMSLLQYLLQKLNMFLEHTNRFNEWKMYLAYQVFAFSMFGPLFGCFRTKRPLFCVLSFGSMIVMPLCFYNAMLTEIYIDPFIGILGGCGVGYLFLSKRRDALFYIYESLICFTSVLGKDIGLFFAILLSVLILIDGAFRKERFLRGLFQAALPMASALLAKASWNIKLLAEGVSRVFGTSKLDFVEYTKAFFNKGTYNYFWEVVHGIKRNFRQRGFLLFETDIALSYLMIVTIDALLFAGIWIVMKKKKEGNMGIRGFTVVSLITALLVYSYSQGAVYCYNFSEYEAVHLASYSRYMNIPFLMAGIVVTFGLLYCIDVSGIGKSTLLSIVPLTVLFVFLPKEYLGKLITNRLAKESQEIRKPFEDLSDQILRSCDGDDAIYIISQENNRFHYWVIKFNVRPNRIGGICSIGKPFYEGDIWTLSISADDWWDELDEEYDYLALYHINDYFLEHYTEHFVNPDEIRDNTLFRIDHDAKKLEIVPNLHSAE